MGKRGEINPVTGITEGKLRSLLKSDLRQTWRNTSRKVFINSVRERKVNPKTGKVCFQVQCCDCGKWMGQTEKAKRTKKDGTLEKKAKSVFEVHHKNGITPMEDIRETLGAYYHDLIYGEVEILCIECHKSCTHGK